MPTSPFAVFSGAGDLTGTLTDIFGSSGSTNVDGTSNTQADSNQNFNTTSTQQTEVDRAAIDKIIKDVLEGNGGLADIFSTENDIGIFNSSEGKLAASDLLANIAGEIAKITATTTTTEQGNQSSSSSQNTQTQQNQQQTNDGLLGIPPRS
jgi:fructose-1,6-bisphosphatase